MLCYAQSKAIATAGGSSNREDALKITSGLVFALATLFRPSGSLNGTIYLYDAIRYFPRVMSAQVGTRDIRRIIATCLAGLFIAAGVIGPQYLAYIEFCKTASGPEARPWCNRTIPSIYAWVQSHYWYVVSMQSLRSHH